MNVAIIDMGSNTIRLSVYDVNGTSFKNLLSKKEMAGLAGYIENGSMSDEGIQRAIAVIRRFKNIINNIAVDEYYVFATAPLRNIDNTEKCIHEIEAATGIHIDAISGEQEAILDFMGANCIADIESGLLIDIGGGSTELVCFRKKEIIEAVSIPIGSLSLHNMYCDDIIPNKKECKKMRQYVKELLKYCDFFKTQDCENIIGVGGTIRATNKLYRRKNKLEENHELSYTVIHNLLESLMDEKENDLILKAIPERVHTIIPGMIILDTIMKTFDSKNIHVSEYGVREGYLVSKVLVNDNERL